MKNPRFFKEIPFMLNKKNYAAIGKPNHAFMKTCWFTNLLIRYDIKGYRYFPVFPNGLTFSLLLPESEIAVFIENPLTQEALELCEELGLRAFQANPKQIDESWFQIIAAAKKIQLTDLKPAKPNCSQLLFSDAECRFLARHI